MTRRIATALVAALLSLPTATSSAALAGAATRARTVEVRVVERHGFHWADAGIGALAAAGIVLVGAGAAVALRRGS